MSETKPPTVVILGTKDVFYAFKKTHEDAVKRYVDAVRLNKQATANLEKIEKDWLELAAWLDSLEESDFVGKAKAWIDNADFEGLLVWRKLPDSEDGESVWGFTQKISM